MHGPGGCTVAQAGLRLMQVATLLPIVAFEPHQPTRPIMRGQQAGLEVGRGC